MKIDNLLEVGLGSGASVKMWRDYLPEAQIHCIEYFDEENKTKWNSADGNIDSVKIYRGDSTKIETWDEIPYDLDVIIDDGDHHPDSQIKTFELAFEHLRSGGYYVVEDLHCGFEQKYGATDEFFRWAFDMIMKQQTPISNYPGNFYVCRSQMQDPIDKIYSYHFFKSCLVLEKA
jgi:precorrin-6B methylase 2